jgi:hypothetical protein
VAKLNSAFDPVVIARTAPWSKRAGMTIKRYHYPASGYQLLAQAQFGEAASQFYGRRGFVGGLPVVAAGVQATVSGRSVGGGNSAAQARAESHASVGQRMAARRAEGQRKIGGGGGGGGGGLSLSY